MRNRQLSNQNEDISSASLREINFSGVCVHDASFQGHAMLCISNVSLLCGSLGKLHLHIMKF